ncbi:hypothetical protein YTPLAS18_26400 [Nitrospira sp.]|nr:hypothetical protein YTPLAS18_26400 [Nitrospira sp.]
MTRYTDITALLVAGGQSRRMGQDKRFLEVGGRSLFGRALDVLEKVFNAVMISVADAEPIPDLHVQRHRVIEDLIPGCATLGGLYTGLGSVETEWMFAVACDMPLLNESLIRLLVERRNEFDYVMPVLPNGPQPLHACYRRTCLAALERRIRGRDFRIVGLLEEPSLKGCLITEKEITCVDPHLLSFMNINTPADLQFIRKLIDQRGCPPDEKRRQG